MTRSTKLRCSPWPGCGFAERLRHEPGLSRAAAQFCKAETNVPGVCFCSVVWPEARRLAGLPAARRGRPAGTKPPARESDAQFCEREAGVGGNGATAVWGGSCCGEGRTARATRTHGGRPTSEDTLRDQPSDHVLNRI